MSKEKSFKNIEKAFDIIKDMYVFVYRLDTEIRLEFKHNIEINQQIKMKNN